MLSILAWWNKKVWEDAGVIHDRLLMWEAATICFFRFFCSGKITVPSAAAFDLTIHLLWDNVAVGNPANPSVICFFLKQSKCDTFGAVLEVFGKPVRPVTTYLWHTSLHAEMLQVYSSKTQGKPVMKSVFTWEVWNTHTSMGLPSNKIVSHNSWIGAATTAAQAGLEDSVVQALGCWSSARSQGFRFISQSYISSTLA